MNTSTYQRKGLGAIFLAALGLASDDSRAQETADAALSGLTELQERVAGIADDLAANAQGDTEQNEAIAGYAESLTNIAADLDDLAGTLTSNNALAQVSPDVDTEFALAIEDGDVDLDPEVQPPHEDPGDDVLPGNNDGVTADLGDGVGGNDGSL